jgi:hypothetical protein
MGRHDLDTLPGSLQAGRPAGGRSRGGPRPRRQRNGLGRRGRACGGERGTGCSLPRACAPAREAVEHAAEQEERRPPARLRPSQRARPPRAPSGTLSAIAASAGHGLPAQEMALPSQLATCWAPAISFR